MVVCFVLFFLKADVPPEAFIWSGDGVTAHCWSLTAVSLLFGNVVSAFHTQFGSSMWPQGKHNKYTAKGSLLVVSVMPAYLHTYAEQREEIPWIVHTGQQVWCHTSRKGDVKSCEFVGAWVDVFEARRWFWIDCFLLVIHVCLVETCLIQLEFKLAIVG